MTRTLLAPLLVVALLSGCGGSDPPPQPVDPAQVEIERQQYEKKVAYWGDRGAIREVCGLNQAKFEQAMVTLHPAFPKDDAKRSKWTGPVAKAALASPEKTCRELWRAVR